MRSVERAHDRSPASGMAGAVGISTPVGRAQAYTFSADFSLPPAEGLADTFEAPMRAVLLDGIEGDLEVTDVEPAT